MCYNASMSEFDPLERLHPCFDELEKVGLYLLGTPQIGILPVDHLSITEDLDELSPADLIKSDKVDVYLTANFAIGQVAWSDRVLNPKSYEENKEFDRLSVVNRDVEIEMMLKEMMWEDDDET